MCHVPRLRLRCMQQPPSNDCVPCWHRHSSPRGDPPSRVEIGWRVHVQPMAYALHALRTACTGCAPHARAVYSGGGAQRVRHVYAGGGAQRVCYGRSPLVPRLGPEYRRRRGLREAALRRAARRRRVRHRRRHAHVAGYGRLRLEPSTGQTRAPCCSPADQPTLLLTRPSMAPSWSRPRGARGRALGRGDHPEERRPPHGVYCTMECTI